jgi:hypothetical protein
MDAKALCEAHRSFLAERDADATGLMIVQAETFFSVVECNPETAIELVGHMQLVAQAGNNIRVVGMTEDCLERAFGPWAYRSVVLPPEAGPDVQVDTESAVSLATSVYLTTNRLGRELKAAGVSYVDVISALPGYH